MARKKEPAKPLLAVKFDFVDSLEAHLNQTMLLLGFLQTLIQLTEEPATAGNTFVHLRTELIGRVDAFRKTYSTFD